VGARASSDAGLSGEGGHELSSAVGTDGGGGGGAALRGVIASGDGGEGAGGADGREMGSGSGNLGGRIEGGGGRRLEGGRGGGPTLGRVTGAESEARLGGGIGMPDGRLSVGGGGGALEPAARATTPDSDGRLESLLASESKISSPEPLPSPLMIENDEISAPCPPVPLVTQTRGVLESDAAWRQRVSTSVLTALRAIAYVAWTPSTRA
jgi:hypothetical protein